MITSSIKCIIWPDGSKFTTLPLRHNKERPVYIRHIHIYMCVGRKWNEPLLSTVKYRSEALIISLTPHTHASSPNASARPANKEIYTEERSSALSLASPLSFCSLYFTYSIRTTFIHPHTCGVILYEGDSQAQKKTPLDQRKWLSRLWSRLRVDINTSPNEFIQSDIHICSTAVELAWFLVSALVCPH